MLPVERNDQKNHQLEENPSDHFTKSVFFSIDVIYCIQPCLRATIKYKSDHIIFFYTSRVLKRSASRKKKIRIAFASIIIIFQKNEYGNV